MTSPKARGSCRSRRPARGAAALVVVLMLLVVVALAAAYASRNLVFEQRTGANQARATQAFEAAEAGLEWALAMLHAGRIDAACTPLADPDAPGETFRDRQLAIDAATGRVTARLRSDGQPRTAACVFDGSSWRCSCPDDAAPTLAAPAGHGPAPAFVVRLHDDPAHPPGVVRVESTGCARLDGAGICPLAVDPGDGRATVSVLVALKGALASAPAAAVTVRGDLDVGHAVLRTANRDAASGGFTLHVGGALTGTPLALHGPGGAPPESTVADEPDGGPLARLDSERLFTTIFGMGRDTYRLQPTTVVVDCAADCSARTLQHVARLNPGTMLWVDGTLRLDADVTLGTPEAPVVLVVDGDVEVTDADVRIHGLVVVTGSSWATSGATTVHGALVGQGDLAFAGTGTSTVDHDPGVLARLRLTQGSFTRVPGSWRDF
jgi:Tfp pilus assembly protein PilX